MSDRADSRVLSWILEVSREQISLPLNISEKDISDSYYLGGFGDSVAIVKIKCDPPVMAKYREECDRKFVRSEPAGGSFPERLGSVNYSYCYTHNLEPSITYGILFYDRDASILIRRKKI